MSNKLYVGNLGFGTSDSELAALFTRHGTVRYAKVVLDDLTGRSRGFGFVEMSSAEEARAAMAAVNGQVRGRLVLIVNDGKPGCRNGGERSDRSAARKPDGQTKSHYSDQT